MPWGSKACGPQLLSLSSRAWDAAAEARALQPESLPFRVGSDFCGRGTAMEAVTLARLLSLFTQSGANL